MSETETPVLQDEPQAVSDRPMDMGTIFDTAVGIYTGHFTLFALSVALVVVPVHLLELLAEESSKGVGAAVSLIGILVDSALVSAVVSITLRDLLFGIEPTVGRSWRLTLRLLWPVLATVAMAFAAVFFASFLFLIPGLLLYVWFIFATQVVVFEGPRYKSALGRSRAIVKGSWWRVFGITGLSTLLLSGSVGIIVAGVGQFVGGGLVVKYVLNAALTIITQPVVGLVIALLFLDVRFRRQGDDLRAAIEALPLPDESLPELSSAAHQLASAGAAARATSGKLADAQAAARATVYHPGHGGENVFERAWHRIEGWIGDFFGWLASLLPGFHLSLGGASVPSGLLYVILLLGILVVLVLVAANLPSRSRKPKRPNPADPHTPAALFETARAEALRQAASDPRAGLRLLYAALLSELGSRRGWRPVPGRSNWTFVRRLGAGSDAGAALAECTRLFEGRVYGHQPAAAEDVQRVSHLADTVLA